MMSASMCLNTSDGRRILASIKGPSVAIAGKYVPALKASSWSSLFPSSLMASQSICSFSVIEIVSFCFTQKGMTGVEGRSPASRRRHSTTDLTSRKSRRQTLCRRAA